jgi:glycosyltransferase involved in cell wall biosynthesis
MIPEAHKSDHKHGLAKCLIDHFGHGWFKDKVLLDAGSHHGDVGAAFWRLGANVLLVDARQEHLKLAAKKYPGIKTLQMDFDQSFPSGRFDICLATGIICHLKNFESFLRSACASANYLIVETAVCDSNDPYMCALLPDNKDVPDWSYNGFSSRPSPAMIERILTECKMTYKRLDINKLNVGKVAYDWQPANNNSCDTNKRRFWIACKDTMELIIPNPVMTPLPTQRTPIRNSSPALGKPSLPNKVFAHDPRIASGFLPKKNREQFRQVNRVPASFSSFKRFAIVIPSYNNSKWCEKNITSALEQTYPHYRIIFTDDCSSDDTFNKVSQIVNNSSKKSQCTLIKNDTRKGALHNLYDMIHSCEDDEIVLTLDGDDWFPHNDVLNKLFSIYESNQVWMTYGQYRNYPDNNVGIAHPYPPEVVRANSFRSFQWGASHLRTFYAWLFKSINVDDLKLNGEFFKMTWDFAIMLPMLEMAGTHSQYVSEVLYVYNMDNPINDHKVDIRLQHDLDRYIRSMTKYQPVAVAPIPPKPNVGLLLIATGKYQRFVAGLIGSADRYFLNGVSNTTYYVFSDAPPSIQSSRNVVHIPIEHRPFPYASADRWKHFVKNADKFGKEQFLFYVDVDCMFVDTVSTEILGNLVGVRHCGFYNKLGPYEERRESTAYVEPSKAKYYFGGGFSGGRKDNYLALAKWCYDAFEKDQANGIMPVWNDESTLNKYFSDHEPDIILPPSYHYPQDNIERYKKIWFPDVFQPKLLLLDKNHAEVRG